jgi:Aminoglycoside 3-N-acetyltransferase
MNGIRRLRELLDALGIARGDLVLLHASYSRMKHLEISAEGFLISLLEHLGPYGTLAMPSYAWNVLPGERPWAGYASYFDQRPPFDVRLTPTNLGHVCEVFRTFPGVLRSESYWWSICAAGALASDLVSGQEKIIHPYGAGSSFHRLMELGGKILGLGVTLNTSSLAPVADYYLAAPPPCSVFTSEPQRGLLIGWSGDRRENLSFTLLPTAVRWMTPSAVFDKSPRLHRILRRKDEGETLQFCYPYSLYHEEALRLGRAALQSGQPLPWLQRLVAHGLDDVSIRAGPPP